MTETTDAFHGQGGSYLLDPQTGERVLIERTQMEQTEQPAAAEPEVTELE